MKEPKVAIIVSSYNQEKLVQENIKILEKTNYKNYKIYLVDDSGNGKIAKKLRKNFQKLKLLLTLKILGFLNRTIKVSSLLKKILIQNGF